LLTTIIECPLSMLTSGEGDEIFFNPHPEKFVESRPNYWTFKDGEMKFPVSFTLKATRL
jgi:hypothetical protein